MRSFRTTPGVPQIFGEGASRLTGEELKKLGATKVFVIYDKGVFNAGIVEPILETLKEAGLEYISTDKVLPDPPDENIEEITRDVNAYDPDALLAIGGGSSLDVAKVISVYRYLTPPLGQYMTLGDKVDAKYKNIRNCILVVIPTTSGTGAEMSGGGVVTDTFHNYSKVSFDTPKCLPDLAILDPVLTTSLPPYVTATTAMDSLCHSIETMTGLKRSARTDMINGYAVELIWRSLPKAFADGKNLEARGELQIAANLAFTSDAGTNFGHGVAHAMGAIHIPHGHICARILPPYVRYMASKHTADKELMLIAEKMHLETNQENCGEVIAQAIEDLQRKLGLKSLRELGVDKGLFMSGMEDLFTTQIGRIHRGNPAPTREEMMLFFEEMYG